MNTEPGGPASRKRPLPGADDGVLALLSDRAPAMQLLPGANLHSGMFKEQTIQVVTALCAELREAVAHRSSPDARGDRKPLSLSYILDKLGDYVVDHRVLQQTQIGKEVGQLKKHAERWEEPNIAKKAEELRTQWKKDLEIRKKVVEGFKEKGSLAQAHALKLEGGLFNVTCPLGFLEGDAYREYQRHFKRLGNHLKSRGPASLVQRLTDGEVCASDVAIMPDEEIMSREKRQKKEADRQNALKDALASTGSEQTGTVSDEYMCPKCQGMRTSYAEIHSGFHTDGQDATIVVTCLNCSNRWKATDDHGAGG